MRRGPHKEKGEIMTGAITYQSQLLTPELTKVLIMDDSPDKISKEFWEFLGVDLPIADIKKWDFWNILDFIDIDILNLLEDYPESEWENVAIVEYTESQDAETKQIPRIAVRAFPIKRIWDKLRTKAYVKMCRAREGITLKSMTTNTSIIDQNIRGMPAQPTQEMGVTQDKRGWKI